MLTRADAQILRILAEEERAGHAWMSAVEIWHRTLNRLGFRFVAVTVTYSLDRLVRGGPVELQWPKTGADPRQMEYRITKEGHSAARW